LAVIHALDDNSEKSRIRSALGRLVIDGAVGTCIENGTHLYKLTDDESVRDSVVHLAKTDWHQWQMMLEQQR
jgi:DNA-binding transcriptional regulator PaaX